MRLLAGVDAAYLPELGLAAAAAVVWDAERAELVERAAALIGVTFPYRPGLLTFREAPALLAAAGRLKLRPQAYLFDGQGLAHPRGLGLAAHIGLWLEAPALGCAKTRLVGTYQPVGQAVGDWSPLQYRGLRVGAVVRTRAGVKPVFVSPGHLMDVAGAIRIVLTSTTGFRQPEPLRQAHLAANLIRTRIRQASVSEKRGPGSQPAIEELVRAHDLEGPDQWFRT